MIAPSAAQIKEWTELDTLSGASAVKAARTVARANAMFLRFTGLRFESVPVELEPLVEQAVQGLAELLTYQTSPETLEALSDFDLIKSFSAGPYSETRRDPAEAAKARLLVPWPWLSDSLWGFMTPERREFYDVMFGGKPAPSFSVSEMDWGGYQELDPPMWGSDF